MKVGDLVRYTRKYCRDRGYDPLQVFEIAKTFELVSASGRVHPQVELCNGHRLHASLVEPHRFSNPRRVS